MPVGSRFGMPMTLDDYRGFVTDFLDDLIVR